MHSSSSRLGYAGGFSAHVFSRLRDNRARRDFPRQTQMIYRRGALGVGGWGEAGKKSDCGGFGARSLRNNPEEKPASA